MEPELVRTTLLTPHAPTTVLSPANWIFAGKTVPLLPLKIRAPKLKNEPGKPSPLTMKFLGQFKVKALDPPRNKRAALVWMMKLVQPVRAVLPMPTVLNCAIMAVGVV